MKPGDIVDWPPLISRAVISEIDGDIASIWWPCPEFGRHTKIAPLADLVLVDDQGSAARHAGRPRRLKDHHLDHHVVRKGDIAERLAKEQSQ